MNVHHLELFYYVALHRGVSEAARRMPYGIQQPAVSAQVAQLENDLGVTLFQRRPFRLSPAGEELFLFIEPFFGGLDAIGRKLRRDATEFVRIGAATSVLRDHLPEILGRVAARFPGLRFTLHDGGQAELEEWMQRGEIDLGVTLIEGKTAPGLTAVKLIDVPLVLLVPARSRIRSATDLWKTGRPSATLIGLPGRETIRRRFETHLSKLGVDWPVAIEVNSLDLVEAYVRGGFGVGLSVAVSGTPAPAGLRVLPLAGFPPVEVGAFWRGKPGAAAREIVDEMKRRAADLQP